VLYDLNEKLAFKRLAIRFNRKKQNYACHPSPSGESATFFSDSWEISGATSAPDYFSSQNLEAINIRPIDWPVHNSFVAVYGVASKVGHVVEVFDADFVGHIALSKET
jgi:hypothetical protein